MSVFTASLLLALAVSLLSLWLFIYLWRRSLDTLRDLRFSSQSRSTRYGQMTEQFMPFISDYPWDPSRFRFIGSPVDGIQFEDERVVFVEFKVGTSKLTQSQRRIRNLVRAGRVEFKEFRLD